MLFWALTAQEQTMISSFALAVRLADVIQQPELTMVCDLSVPVVLTLQYCFGMPDALHKMVVFHVKIKLSR